MSTASLEDEEYQISINSLHRSNQVLREEIIYRDKRIQELEAELRSNRHFDDLFTSRNLETCSCRSFSSAAKQSQTDVSSFGSYTKIKEWSSEPFLPRLRSPAVVNGSSERSSSVASSRRPMRTTISLRLKVPNLEARRLSDASTEAIDDIRALRNFVRKARSETLSDDSDDLIEEARDFLNVAATKLVTVEDWHRIKKRPSN